MNYSNQIDLLWDEAAKRFLINDKVVIITGGAGLLGRKHAETVIEGGGIPVLMDISDNALEKAKGDLEERYRGTCRVDGIATDITQKEEVVRARELLLEKYHHIDVLINNAANNPKMESASANMKAIQFENFPIEIWNKDVAVGLTGACICAQVFGEIMAKNKRGG